MSRGWIFRRLAAAAVLVAAVAHLAWPGRPAPALAGPRQDDDDEVNRMAAHAAPGVWLVEAEVDDAKYGAAKPVGGYKMVKLGSAFVWRSDDGWLITSASVVGDSSKVSIVQPRKRLDAEVYAVDHESDVALLKVGTGQLGRFLPLAAPGQAKLGYHAYVLGPEMVPLRFGDGRINHTDFRLPGYRDPLLVLNVAVDVAASGSPVLGSDGKVIGMVYATGLGARAVGRAWKRPSNVLSVSGVVAQAQPVDKTGKSRQYVYVVPLDGRLQIQVDENNAPQVMQVGPDGSRITVELVCRAPADDRPHDPNDPADPKADPKGEPKAPRVPDGQLAAWSDLAFGKAPTVAMGAAQGPPTYAVPVDTIASVAEDLKAFKRVPRGYMGVAVRDSENPPGAQVHWVITGGPAAKAGLTTGDVIIAVGDKPVSNANEYIRLLRTRRADESLPVTVHSAGGQSRMLHVRLTSVMVEAVPLQNAAPNRGPAPAPPGGPGPRQNEALPRDVTPTPKK